MNDSRLLPWRWPLHAQILLGLVIGALAGLALGAWAVPQIPAELPSSERGAAGHALVTSTWLWQLFDLGGDVFLQGLKLIIVPLVTSSITLAIAGIGSSGGFGRLGSKTLAYYAATSLFAILGGLALVNLVQPGVVDGQPILVGQDLSSFASEAAEVASRTDGRGGADFLDVFRAMVPDNLFAAAANNGRLLGLIVVSMLVGYFLTRLEGEVQQTMRRFVQGVYDLTLHITDFVLALAPIGVALLIAATVSEQWAKLRPDGRFTELITGVGWFAGTALAALLIHLFVVMPLLLALVARVNPLRHFQAMAPAMLTAFSTASSSATLPVTLDCVQERAGVSEKTASFTLPLGATVNMDGTALYECVAALFICQAFGIELGLAQQFLVVVVALLTSIGVAGVPSASLVAIAIILQAVQEQLPSDAPALVGGMALLFVFDRPLDMVRTTVNIFSDSVGAVLIARSEGESPLSEG